MTKSKTGSTTASEAVRVPMSDSDGGNALADAIENGSLPAVMCGHENRGAVCKRPAGHEGLHCSIPELMGLDAFAQVEAEAKDPAARTHVTDEAFILGQVDVLFDRIVDKTITIAMARIALSEAIASGHTVEYVLSLRG